MGSTPSSSFRSSRRDAGHTMSGGSFLVNGRESGMNGRHVDNLGLIYTLAMTS